MSDAASAAATVSPSSASISRPSKPNRTGEPVGRMSGCFRRMAKGLQWGWQWEHRQTSYLLPRHTGEDTGGGEPQRRSLYEKDHHDLKSACTRPLPAPSLPSPV